MDDYETCPVHGIPDCSPLLNGCTKMSDEAIAQRRRYETAARIITASAPPLGDADVEDALAGLVADGMMEVEGEGENRRYRMTAKGKAAVEGIVGGLLS